MEKNNRFKKGSGCFRCVGCGKLTRQTGRHNWHTQEFCDDCIDEQEHENSHNDNPKGWDCGIIDCKYKTKKGDAV